MQLTDFARKVPDDVWALFEPVLPPVIWCGKGCPPYGNRECFHAVLYVLVTGIGWRMLPPGFPSDKTVHRRLERWVRQGCLSDGVTATGPALRSPARDQRG